MLRGCGRFCQTSIPVPRMVRTQDEKSENNVSDLELSMKEQRESFADSIAQKDVELDKVRIGLFLFLLGFIELLTNYYQYSVSLPSIPLVSHFLESFVLRWIRSYQERRTH